MNWHLEPIDWIDRLSQGKYIPKSTRNALSCAMYSNGFITGGAARALAAVFLGPQHIGLISSPCGFSSARHEDHLDTFRRMITLSRVPDEVEKSPSLSATRIWKGNVRDIDVFFPTKNDVITCISSLNAAGEHDWNQASLANYGQEYIFGRNLIQLMTYFLGTPDELLGSFDLSNAKVYFDAQGLHWSDEWLQLEHDGVLGIDCSDKQNFLWRISKWMHNHKYKNLREGDHKKYTDAVFKAIDDINDEKFHRWGLKVGIGAIQGHAKKLIYLMPPAEALKASIILDSYDQLNIIRNIANKAIQT